MNRNTAITAENNVMDELARLSAELHAIDLLIIHHRQHPTVIKHLSAVRRRLIAERTRLQAMRALLAQEI